MCNFLFEVFIVLLILLVHYWFMESSCILSWDLPDSSAGKESSFNAGNPSSIPGLGRSARKAKKVPTPVFWLGELHGLQSVGSQRVKQDWATFTFVSLVVLTVKNLPAVQETWVLSLCLEDSLEKEMATYSSILAWKIPWTEKPGRL